MIIPIELKKLIWAIVSREKDQVSSFETLFIIEPSLTPKPMSSFLKLDWVVQLLAHLQQALYDVQIIYPLPLHRQIIV